MVERLQDATSPTGSKLTEEDIQEFGQIMGKLLHEVELLLTPLSFGLIWFFRKALQPIQLKQCWRPEEVAS